MPFLQGMTATKGRMTSGQLQRQDSYKGRTFSTGLDSYKGRTFSTGQDNYKGRTATKVGRFLQGRKATKVGRFLQNRTTSGQLQRQDTSKGRTFYGVAG